MSLAEYQSDQRLLFERLSKTDSEGRRFVDTYLRVRKYSDDELLLLIQISEEQMTEKALDAHTKWLELGPGISSGTPQINLAWEFESDLISILRRALTTPPYPFEKINPRYLTVPGKSKVFQEAETFMIQFRYFHKNGKWNENLELKDLITFFNLMLVAGILKYSTQKDMDAYFSNRYKMESIGDLLKPNKLKQYTKFEQFSLLITQLGLKIEDLRKVQ